MIIVERSQEDIDNETRLLYEEIKPLLDCGYSVNKAVRMVKGKNSVNSKLAWYRRLVEYVDMVRGE